MISCGCFAPFSFLDVIRTVHICEFSGSANGPGQNTPERWRVQENVSRAWAWDFVVSRHQLSPSLGSILHTKSGTRGFWRCFDSDQPETPFDAASITDESAQIEVQNGAYDADASVLCIQISFAHFWGLGERYHIWIDTDLVSRQKTTPGIFYFFGTPLVTIQE